MILKHDFPDHDMDLDLPDHFWGEDLDLDLKISFFL